MGALIHFTGAADSSLPPARRALSRCFVELAALKAEDERLAGMETSLQAAVDKAIADEGRYDEAIAADATMLISRMREGLSGLWGSIGGRARRAGAGLIEIHTDKLVAERALNAIRVERDAIANKIAERKAQSSELVASAVAEAAQGVVDDYATALENARDAMIRVAGLERFLGITRIGRVVGIMPDFTGEGFDEQAIVAPAGEIARAVGAFRSFAQALAKDPHAPASLLALPDVNPEPEDVVYSDMTAIERARVDSEFRPPERRQRPTFDSENLAEAIRSIESGRISA